MGRAVIENARAAGALPELAHAYYLAHLAYTSLGSPKRNEVRELALPIYEELGDLLGQANALNNLGIDAYYEGRWEDALGFYGRSRAARDRIGDVVGAATIANNIAEILSDQGRIVEAEAELREVRAICEAAGSRLMTAVADANLGRAAARAGGSDEARELLSAAIGSLREIDAGSFVVEVQARLAEAALFAGDFEGALASVDEAEAITGTSAPPAVQALLHRIRGQALPRARQRGGRGTGVRREPPHRARRRDAVRDGADPAGACEAHGLRGGRRRGAAHLPRARRRRRRAVAAVGYLI